MRCVTLAQADANKATERLFLYLTCNNCFLNLWLYVLLLKYRLNMGFEEKNLSHSSALYFRKYSQRCCLNSSLIAICFKDKDICQNYINIIQIEVKYN